MRRSWKDGRAYSVASLRDCVCWSDLIRLAQWYLIHWLDRSPKYCWAELCRWAWHGWEDGENWPRESGSPCEAEGRTGQCYCGKFPRPTPAGSAVGR